MPRHLHEITAAMNAYAWTKHGPVQGTKHAPSYCAIGALLRHTGVPHDRIMEASIASLTGAYDGLLSAKYGISGAETVMRIMRMNDGAQSKADAIWRLLGLVSGTRQLDDPVPRARGAHAGPELPPAA